VLAGGVAGHRQAALEGQQRGDVDHLAAAAIEHPGAEEAGQLEDAVQVDRHHPAPVLQGQLDRRPAVDRPRVVHQDVHLGQPAQLAPDPVRVGQVEPPPGGPAAGGQDRGLDLVQRFGPAAVHDHVGAGRGQPDGDRGADPGRGAGHQRGPPGQVEQGGGVHRNCSTGTTSTSVYSWFSPPIAQTNA
jgi:hypothetical protein